MVARSLLPVLLALLGVTLALYTSNRPLKYLHSFKPMSAVRDYTYRGSELISSLPANLYQRSNRSENSINRYEMCV